MFFRHVLSIFLAAILIAGCGFSPEKRSYEPQTPPAPPSGKAPDQNDPDTSGGKGNQNGSPSRTIPPVVQAPPIVVQQQPLAPPPVIPAGGPVVNSGHAKAELVGNAWRYEIKSQVNQPTLLRQDNSEFSTQFLEDIRQNDMAGLAYVLLPEGHWFIKENPFAAESAHINLRRLMLWDNELVVVKREHNSVLLKKKQPDQPYTLKEYDPNVLFPNFAAQLLGKGGQGVVYDVTYQGNHFALKHMAKEWREMERLFFTGGVLEIYGYFKHQNEVYMLMPKAIKSLKESIKDDDHFTLSQDNIDALARALHSANALGIDFQDIKPHNVVLTKGGPKLIDISINEYTIGYTGSKGLKLLQTLLEGLSNERFLGGEVALDRYYEFEPGYRMRKVASVDYMKYFLRFVCRQQNLLNDCSTINDFDGLYSTLPRQKLNAIAQAFNARWNDSSGTKETYGLYHTGLDFPQLLDPAGIDYTLYFAQRDTIVQRFCGAIKPIALAPATQWSSQMFFFKQLLDRKPNYEALCQNNPATKAPLLLEQLTDAHAPAFKDFIFDAFAPSFQFQIFQQLAQANNRPQVLLDILEQEGNRLGLANSIINALKQLPGIP